MTWKRIFKIAASMFSLISSLTSTIMDCRRSFINQDTWFFQFSDLFLISCIRWCHFEFQVLLCFGVLFLYSQNILWINRVLFLVLFLYIRLHTYIEPASSSSRWMLLKWWGMYHWELFGVCWVDYLWWWSKLFKPLLEGGGCFFFIIKCYRFCFTSATITHRYYWYVYTFVVNSLEYLLSRVSYGGLIFLIEL